MIAVLLADGFEEIEALCPVDILRRAGLDVRTVGVYEKNVTGSHGITVVSDMTADELDENLVEHVIFPGGMPGAVNLDEAKLSDKLIDVVSARGGIIAAICAAPLVLGRRGILRGKRAVCFPGFEHELDGATILSGTPVAVDGNIITGNGMEAALPFAKAIADAILSK